MSATATCITTPSRADAQDNAAFIAAQPAVHRCRRHRACPERSISAEHGLGQLKREEIRRYKSPVELAAMRAVKQAFDPAGLMNPGKLI